MLIGCTVYRIIVSGIYSCKLVTIVAKSTYYCYHVRPSVRMYGAAPAGRVSMEYDVGDFGEKSVETTQIRLKSFKKYRTFYMQT
jgi:hypothetical protein